MSPRPRHYSYQASTYDHWSGTWSEECPVRVGVGFLGLVERETAPGPAVRWTISRKNLGGWVFKKVIEEGGGTVCKPVLAAKFCSVAFKTQLRNLICGLC